MVTSVMVEDYVTNSVFYTIFDDEDMDYISDKWFQEDSLLMGLQKTKEFDGRRCLADLKPWHFHFLITNNLEVLFELPEDERKNPECAEVKSLEVLVSAFLFHMHDHCNSRVEFMKIQRVEPGVVNFDYRASLMLELKYPEPKRGLSVVVDNSRNDESPQA